MNLVIPFYKIKKVLERIRCSFLYMEKVFHRRHHSLLGFKKHSANSLFSLVERIGSSSKAFYISVTLSHHHLLRCDNQTIKAFLKDNIRHVQDECKNI